MSSQEPPKVEAYLSEAASLTSKYDWEAASKSYNQALNQIDPKEATLRFASIKELLAICHFQYAMQAESRVEFLKRMKVAMDSYEELAALYARVKRLGFAKRAEGRAVFASFWLKEKPSEKKDLLGRCITLADEAIRIFESEGEKGNLAAIHGDQLSYCFEAHFLSSDAHEFRDLYEKTIRIAKLAAIEYEALHDDMGFVESMFAIAVLLSALSTYVYEPETAKDLVPELEDSTRRLSLAAQRNGTAKAVCLAQQAVGWKTQIVDANPAKALEIFESAVAAAEPTRDSMLIGRSAQEVVGGGFTAGSNLDDVEQRRAAFEKGIAFSLKSIKYLTPPFHGSWLSIVYAFYPECHNYLATLVETDLIAKKAQLRKAIDSGRTGMAYAEYCPLATSRHTLAKALYYLATLESNIEKKRELLDESLKIREVELSTTSRWAPNSWEHGVQWNYLALVKTELSKLATDEKLRIELLKNAVADMERCIERCLPWVPINQNFAALAWYEESYGDILVNLYGFTCDIEYARNGMRAYDDAIAHDKKLDLAGRIPPIRWKIARVHDALGEHSSASAAFNEAAADYREAAGKFTGLRSTFEEFSAYMEAWASIEQARLHHKDGQYTLAAEAYAKAREFLESSKTWNYLATHYGACSMLDQGEALSREEKPEEAIHSFSASIEAFRECATALDTRLKGYSEPREQEELKGWISLSANRSRYCKGRRELEEANLLDKKGEKEASSRKYHSAAAVFKELSTEAANEQDRRELADIELVCEARAKMKEAEAEASPELYAEAARMFMKSREGAARSHGLQALADASLCRALEAGTRFRLTRDSQLYSEIKKHLETAGDYYHQAGLKSKADWAMGTQRFFDALVYLADAEIERGREKRTELYHLAEKHLELAAKLYDGAGYPKKKGEALNYLQKAREEKELLLTPMEVLNGNPASSGGIVTPVSLDRDQAKGLERFEEASLVGNMSVPRGDVNVGADLTVELQIANLGKTSATLIKLENMAPEGLELSRDMGSYQVEDGFINMRGKRLEYLKTDMVKIALRAARKGAYLLKPRLLFVDEKGNYKSLDFEPAPLTVKELGISGWLKGSGK